MATTAKRASAIHPHSRRIRNPTKSENSPPKAHAEKLPVQTVKQNNPKPTLKAKINRKIHEGSAKRTIVTKYLSEITNWQKHFREDKFFRYRVISRRYLRKLSLHSNKKEDQRDRRKVSWENQIEILVFDYEQNPSGIGAGHRLKESLNAITL